MINSIGINYNPKSYPQQSVALPNNFIQNQTKFLNFGVNSNKVTKTSNYGLNELTRHLSNMVKRSNNELVIRVTIKVKSGKVKRTTFEEFTAGSQPQIPNSSDDFIISIFGNRSKTTKPKNINGGTELP